MHDDDVKKKASDCTVNTARWEGLVAAAIKKQQDLHEHAMNIDDEKKQQLHGNKRASLSQSRPERMNDLAERVANHKNRFKREALTPLVVEIKKMYECNSKTGEVTLAPPGSPFDKKLDELEALLEGVSCFLRTLVILLIVIVLRRRGFFV